MSTLATRSGRNAGGGDTGTSTIAPEAVAANFLGLLLLRKLSKGGGASVSSNFCFSGELSEAAGGLAPSLVTESVTLRALWRRRPLGLLEPLRPVALDAVARVMRRPA